MGRAVFQQQRLTGRNVGGEAVCVCVYEGECVCVFGV